MTLIFSVSKIEQAGVAAVRFESSIEARSARIEWGFCATVSKIYMDQEYSAYDNVGCDEINERGLR